MPAEQRIIGGGLLIVGVAVVLILIYFFSLSGPAPSEAYDTIFKKHWPTYTSARDRADYVGMKRAAADIVEVMDSAGRAGVAKLFKGEGLSSKEAKEISGLIESGAFDKNVEGLYRFEGGWYEDTAHRGLTALKKAVDDMKVLRHVRDVAKKAATMLELARTGSGHPISLPAAKPVPTDDVPIVSPNPVYANDMALYLVFGVKATDLEKAFATPPPANGTKAWSAREQWNKKVPSSNLPKDLASVPNKILELRNIASSIERAVRALKGNASADKAVDRFMTQAAAILGAGLAPEHRAQFDGALDKFKDGLAVARVLEKEAAMLNDYNESARLLGRAFEKKFKQ